MQQNYEYYPLTHPQKGIWYTEKLYPDTSIGIIAGTLRIEENVDFIILEKAINLFIKKNDSMRIRIAEIEGKPYQYFSDYEYYHIDFLDFSDKDISEMYKWDTIQTKTPFKLLESNLFYFAIIKVSDFDAGFYIKCHHLISDAWSMSLLGSQVMVYYSNLKNGTEISNDDNPSYIKFINSEHSYLESDRLIKDRDYWNGVFEKYPSKIFLKDDANNISFKARRKTMLTPIKLTAKINQFCSEFKTSVFSLFTAALAMYINRVTAKEDIVLGTTTLNRSNVLEKSTVGMFNNITPMRINISDSMDFTSLIGNVSSDGFKLLRHQKYPYDLLLKEIREKHKIDDSVFNIVLIYQNSKFLKDILEEQYFTRWHFNGYQVDSLHISINDRENEGHLIIDYDYHTDVFQAKEIEFIHQNIINILWHALDNPSKKISHLEMLSEKEKHRILYEFNKTKIVVPQWLRRTYGEYTKKIPKKVKSYILDKNLNLLPIGITGELYFSTPNLSEKKKRAMNLVDNEAVDNPYASGELLYRTGINARWFPDGDIMLIGDIEHHVAGENKDPASKDKTIKINIMSTFTAEPIEDYLVWWGTKFGYKSDVKFAKYNQVFQELLNPESMMSGNIGGIDVALIRFEDFIRYETGTDGKKMTILERSYHDLKEAFDRFGNSIPLIITIFPVSENYGLSNSLKHKIEKINKDFSDTISKYKNIFMLDFNNLNILYNIQDTFDVIKDKEAHMPFTDEYYAAIGTEIARKILAIKSQRFKVIVLDCDNTLWKGICGEIGALGVHVTDPYRKLQRFMLRKYNEGMLLAICSKNNMQDVIEVFNTNPDMVLNQSHIISWKVSWEEKSAAIREISHELGVGLDSLIFIDDDSLECLKMLENCPEVLTLQLPSDENHIPSFLDHVWAFDKVRVTTEDALRNHMYQQENKRKALKNKGISLENFLKSLELKVSMRFIAEDEIARAAQLTQRTNQFNLSTIRRNEEDIALLIKDAGTVCFVVEVSDKFGDYGIIGLIILKNMCGILLIDTFLLSCRIFGRKVEDVILAGIGKYAEEVGISEIEATFIPTEKNKAIYDFLVCSKWRLVEKTNKYHRYSMNASNIPKSDNNIEFYYMDVYEKAVDDQIDRSNSLIMEYESVNLCVYRLIGENDIDFDTSLIARNINHKEFIEPLQYSSGKKLVHIFADTNSSCSYETVTYENEMQKRLIKIWESTLRVHNIGIDSDFFELGGDSLHAVILISRIEKDFGIELTLRDVFQFSTIRKMEQKIKQSETLEYGRITPIDKKQYYELSSAQKRMYIINKIESDQTAYNECHRIKIEGKLSRLKLEAAFKEFIQRHEIMRTGFEMIDERPVQHVYDKIDFNISYLKAREKYIEKIIDEFIKPFDLSKPPLIRVCLIETGVEKFTLLIDIHHIIIDGASFGILIRELQALYGGRDLDPPVLQYRDFVNWQKELFNQPQFSKQEQYWLEQFNNEVPILNIPTDNLRMPIQSFIGRKKHFTIGADIFYKLKAICADSGSTMFMLLFAAFNVLLHRYSGQEDIVVGIPVSGRKHIDTRNIVGMFVNTLPIRTYPKSNISFLEYLINVKESILMALENQDYQYEMLVDKLKVPRELNRNPLFDVLFSLQNTDMPELDIAGLTMNLCNINNHKSKFDISMLVTEKDTNLEFCLEYCTDLFNDDYISRFQEHFTNILDDVSADSQKCISDIEIMSEIEKHWILDELNDTSASYPKDMTIHKLFEVQAKKTPDKVAIVFENKEMTYSELNVKANQLARVLRNKGVNPDTIVAIMIERSLEMIIGILAILKAGGAYLPIDPEYPQERVKYILEDSGAKILLTQNGFPKMIKSIKNTLLIDDKKIYSGDSANLVNLNDSDDLVYMIYTSGSTGKPKGVMLEHRNISNFIKGVTDRINIDKDDVMLCITTISFDIFVLETWLPLIRGIKIVIANKNEQLDIGLLADMVAENNVTVLQMTPSRMKLVCDDLRSEKMFRSIKLIMLGGEPLSVSLLESIKLKTTARIYNMYGPTETSVWSSIKDMTNETAVCIGKPINNTQFFILSESLRLQPIGIPGELYIAGDGLARGYFNKPELTNERFIDNPINGKGRIYQTGDLSVLLSSGDIKVIGRLDNQVKLGGHRIELEEIEKILLQYEDITECAVNIKQSDASPFLCAFFVSDVQILDSSLIEFLKKKLPGYMIPKQFIRLSKLPLNNNNKIDRNALNKINTEISIGLNTVQSEGEVQLGLEDIFIRILNVKSISANKNFLDLGADSLQIIRLTIEIYNFFGVELRYGEILTSNTIQELSKLISEKLLNNYSSGIDIGTIYALLNEKRNENIFAFPPITGFGLAFNEMAKNIKDYSLYSFNYIEDESKIEQYYQAIKSIQKSGPYVLLGFSAGADIVYELSKKFIEKTLIILMDGFWGEVSINEIEKKIDFFIDYSMSYANLDKNNKFLTHILEQRIRSYMYYVLNKNKFISKIDDDIHFLYSEELSNQDIEKLTALTKGKIFRYKAFGKHFELLQKGYVDKNAKILINIVSGK